MASASGSSGGNGWCQLCPDLGKSSNFSGRVAKSEEIIGLTIMFFLVETCFCELCRVLKSRPQTVKPRAS